MAPTKRIDMKKRAAKKGWGGKRSWSTPSEGEVDIDNTAAAKKLAIRQPFESALNLQSDIHLLWIGSPPALTTLHSSLLPTTTLAILARSRTQPYPGLPIDFHTITDTTHETFEIYRNFLYTGKLFSHDAHGDQDYADNGRDEAHEDREWVRLALAYFLGLRLGDEGFCNGVVDGLVEKMVEADRSPTGLATEVYAHTSHGDKLRALLVDLHVWKGLGTWILPPHDDANGPTCFLRDVRRGLKKAGDEIQDADIPMPWEIDLCQYHVHTTTTPCERKASAVAAESEAGTVRKLRKTSPSEPPQTPASDRSASFVCAPCSKPFSSASALDGHKASPGHKKNAKKWGAGPAQ